MKALRVAICIAALIVIAVCADLIYKKTHPKIPQMSPPSEVMKELEKGCKVTGVVARRKEVWLSDSKLKMIIWLEISTKSREGRRKFNVLREELEKSKLQDELKRRGLLEGLKLP